MKKRKNNEIQYVKGDPAVEAGMFNDMMGNGSMTEEVEDRYVDLSGMSEYNIKNEIKSSSSQTTPDKDKKSFNFANTIDRKAKILKETDKAYLLLINYKRWNKERTGKDDYSIIAWVSKHPFGKNGKITLKPIQENIKEGYQDRTTIGKRKQINEGISWNDDLNWLYDWINDGKPWKNTQRWNWSSEEGKAFKDLGKYNEQQFNALKNEEDWTITHWLKEHNFNYDLSVGDYDWTTKGKLDRGWNYHGSNNNKKTSKNRMLLNINLNQNIKENKPTITLNSKDDKSINEQIKIKSRGVRASLNEDKIPSSVRRLIDIINGKGNDCEINNGKLIVRNRDSRVGNTTFPITKEQERKLKELGYLNESLKEGKQETFTSKEANELSKEFRDYLYNLDIPKYYDVRAEKVNDGEYIIRVNIEYGDLVHDHKYLDDMAKQFFNDKDINIMIYEPQELKSEIDEDNIYSSSHIIQKSGNKIYQVKKDDDFLEEEE